MSDLVERVARAMAKVISERHGHKDNGYLWLNDERREEAQAAIEATGVVELRSAAQALLNQFHSYRDYSDLNHQDAHNLLVRYKMWDALELALSQLAKGSE